MAYIAGSASYDSAGTTNAFECALPPHQAGDLLLAQLSQDTGTGVFSATDWDVIGTHAASSAMRSGWLGRIAASGSTPDPVFESTLTDDMVVTIYVVRDADTSSTVANAIHQALKADVTGSGPQTSPAMTTTVDNCLLLYSFGYDGAGFVVLDPSDVTFVERVNSNGFVSCASGFYQQQAQGAVPSITANCTANDGGTAWVLAIKNATGGSISPTSTRTGETLMRFSGASTDTNLTADALSNIAATIDGRTVDTNALSLNATQDDADALGGRYEFYTSAASLSDHWVGSRWALAATANLVGKVVSISWRIAVNSLYGDDGWIVVFADSTGDWAAFRLLRPYQLKQSEPLNSIIRPDMATPIASGGTISWSDVTHIGFGYHRITAASTSVKGIGLMRVIAIEAPIMVAGSQAAPVSAASIGALFSPAGIGLPGVYDAQGEGQLLLRSSVQIGDGSRQTYYNALGTSIEFPADFVALGKQKFWNVPADGAEVVVRASSSDTIRFGGGSIRGASRQKFTIHASSSTAASYDFAGAVFLGLSVTWQAGVTCNDASFVECYTVTANGGTFNGCSFRRSPSTVALTTDDLGEIIDCEFVSSGDGHAIEITAPGTYTFAGNTFTGYGADGTTDAAIYNNSGGAVTINVAGGGDTPTVRNGTGASTTVNNNVTLTLENVVVGSAIRIELEADGSLVEYRLADATTEAFAVPAGDTYRVKVRKASGAPFYKNWSTLATPAADQSIFVSQILDE